MKRIKAACICQTLHFMLKDGCQPEDAGKMATEELNHYKAQLDRSRTRYKILEEVQQPDGSWIIKIMKQYNSSPVGDYLD